MRPLDYYQSVSARADGLFALGQFISSNTTSAVSIDEILRAEWVARVSALDLYVHELVAQCLMEILTGRRVGHRTDKIHVSLATIMQAQNHHTGLSLVDLEIRQRLGRETFQDPDAIADAIRLINPVELWNEISIRRGNIGAGVASGAKALKGDLRSIVSRRNKIVHEGDLQPGAPRTPWPVSQNDLVVVRETISRVVEDIDAIVY